MIPKALEKEPGSFLQSLLSVMARSKATRQSPKTKWPLPF